MATTLTTLQDRMEVILGDAANVRFTSSQYQEAIRRAMQIFSTFVPRKTTEVITLNANGRGVAITGLTSEFIAITAVEYPHDSTTPDEPPNYVPFEVWTRAVLYLDTDTQPASGEKIKLWYNTNHTLSGLDSATETTLIEMWDSYVADLAVAYLMLSDNAVLSVKATLSRYAVINIADYTNREFKRAIDAIMQLARQEFIPDSGVSGQPKLDRYDENY